MTTTSTHAAPTWMAPTVQTAGEAPNGTRMDTVELLVHDLDNLTAFYHEAVGLDILNQSGATTTLGRGNAAIMKLTQKKELPGRNPYGAGLYHTAIVFQNQAKLADTIVSMAQKAGTLYEGSADHLVSEAFYFHDPEGNGLELYHDRPRDQWHFEPNGYVKMATLGLDPNAFVNEWYGSEASSPAADSLTVLGLSAATGAPSAADPTAAIGHVHLQVGDIATARKFYVDTLGFDITTDLGSALFISAGGYHHHIGINTWQSAGAGPRAASLGLGDVRIVVPNRTDVEAFADRVKVAGIDYQDDGATLHVKDPWGTTLAITPE